MKLSDLALVAQEEKLCIDGSFDALGMVTTVSNKERVLSFLATEEYLPAVLANKNIAALVTTAELYKKDFIPSGVGVITAADPKAVFFRIHNYLVDKSFYWQSFPNQIAQSAQISGGAFVANNSVIVGENSLIEPGVTIYPGTVIGRDVVIRSGSRIGVQAFQFNNSCATVKSGGQVEINDHVEIQANCSISRGVFGGRTVLSKRAKLSSGVHVAHDVILGERTLVAAGVVIGGRTVIGADCWLGLNATISNGVAIGDGAKISLGAVVTRDVPGNTTVSGNFAIDHPKFIEFIKSIR